MTRRFGYGYPSYIENAFQASCYDGMKFTQQLYARTAAWNAAHEKAMAESWAARQPVYDAPPPPPRPNFSPEPAQDQAWFKVCEARQTEEARQREAFDKGLAEARAKAEANRWFEALREELAARQAQEARQREASEKARAEAQARQAEETRKREAFEKALAEFWAARRPDVSNEPQSPWPGLLTDTHRASRGGHEGLLAFPCALLLLLGAFLLFQAL